MAPCVSLLVLANMFRGKLVSRSRAAELCETNVALSSVSVPGKYLTENVHMYVYIYIYTGHR